MGKDDAGESSARGLRGLEGEFFAKVSLKVQHVFVAFNYIFWLCVVMLCARESANSQLWSEALLL